MRHLLLTLIGIVSCTLLHAQNCTADYTFDSDMLTYEFTDQSTSSDGTPIDSWSWDFGDGSTSNEQNPTHTFPEDEDYDVCLTVTTVGGCTSSQYCIEIEICELAINLVQGNCDANDNIPIDITISDPYDEAKEIDVFIDGVLDPGSPYDIEDDEPVFISTSVPGDGLIHTVTAQSLDVGTCIATDSFSVPDCGSNCFLSSMSVEIANPTTHNVDVGDNFFDPSNVTIEVGDIVEWVWIGSGHTTTSDATSGPDSWATSELDAPATYQHKFKIAGTHNYYCAPHGGPGGSGMSGVVVSNCPSGTTDIDYEISFNTSIADPMGYNVYIDGNLTPGSPYSYSGTGPNSLVLSVPGDGLTKTIMIEDVADPACTISREVTTPDCGSAPSCSLTLSANQSGSCDNNNDVPYDITVNDINGGNSFSVTVDGNSVPGSPFNYNSSGTTTLTINVPGDGQQHTIEVVDSDDPGCTDNINVTTPDCSTPCSITNLQITTGAPAKHTVEVQDFDFQPSNLSITQGDTVEFLWTGAVDHTSTSDATSGPDSWDSGLLGNGATFLAPILSTGNHPYYCIPHGSPGGVGMSGTITVNPDCNNGMVSATLTFQSSGTGFNGYNVLIDGNIDSGSPFSYDASGNNSVNVLLPGDGQSHTIAIEDVDDPTCNTSTNYTTIDCNQTAPCELTVAATVNGSCDNNNEVPVDITVTNLNSGNQFDLLLDGNAVPGSPYNYDPSGTTNITINVPGDGQSHTIEVVDTDDASCSDNTALTTPDCSVPCSITNLQVSTGQAAKHIVQVADFDFQPENLSITQGDTVEFVWTGAVDHTSTSDATSGPDSWDSGLLGTGASFLAPILSIGNHPYYCVPHGAPGGVGMSGTITVNPDCNNGFVSATLTFESSGTGSAGFNVLIDGNIESGSPYNYDASGNNSVNVLLPGDGQSHIIAIEDVDDPTCNTSTNYTTIDCNQTAPCELTVAATVNGSCDNNNEVPVDITVTNLNSGNQFDLLLDGNAVPGSPYNYDPSGTTNITINVPGDGQSHTIEVVDTDDASCSDNTSLTTPDCSVPCSVTNLQVSTGQASKHIVQVADFDFQPENLSITQGDTVEFVWTGAVDHTSTSDATSGPDSWDSGLLGTGASFLAPILSIGNHPYYCVPHGAPGGVGMSGTITVNPDCNNGLVSATLTFESSGTGPSGFNVLIDGNIESGSPYNYDASGNNSVNILLPGDGQSHSITIEDVDEPTCSANTNFTTTDCNQTAPCELTLSAAVNGSCDNNNEVPVDLTVTNLNSGSQFDVLLDGNAVPGSPYNYDPSGTTNITINVPGDGQSHTIEVVDADDASCSDNTALTTPDCSIPCSISNLQISAGQATVHSVEVADFDFIPQNLSITEGDTVEFYWTGAVDHTATSDAPSGADSWDSGLLGNGATYRTPVLSIGNHPYYCIPHGAPGGVGMSGNITVNPNCENGLVSATLSFEAMGTGSGFNILIDGNPDPNNPYNYAPSGNNSVNILLPGDGQQHIIEIQDADEPACLGSLAHTTTDCNQTAPCDVGITSNISGSCDNNNEVPVDLTITNLNSGTEFDLLLDGNAVSGSPFTYDGSGTTQLTINVNGDGQTHNIEVIDSDDPSCTASTSLTTPDCINNNCTIEQLTLSSDEPVSHTIEVKDFSFEPATLNVNVGDTIHFIWVGQVAHTATSDASSGPDSWDSGLLGQGETFEVIIETAGSHPYYCIPHGAPGGVGMAGVINASNNCENGLVNVNIYFESDRTAFDTYNVLFDGNISGNSPYNYSPNGINNISLSVSGDGQAHQIEIQDVEIPSCSASNSITLSNCGGSTCLLDIEANNISACDTSGSFSVDLYIDGLQNSNGGFDLYVNATKYNTSPYPQPSTNDTSITISLQGDGSSKNIEVRDINQGNCNSTTQIQAPVCGNFCVLAELSVSSVDPAIHEVEVRDFDFSPENIQIIEGDSIRFVWTGDIDHSTTSDATSGPDSWDSGVIGKGSEFTVSPSSIGDHPYYCIPHGGPGGIGMAGNIEVLPQCEGDSTLISATFTAQNAGGAYNIFVDGKLQNDTVINYTDPDGKNSFTTKIFGDGLVHTLTVQDTLTGFCAISKTFIAPQCGPPCVIEELEVNQGSDIKHIVAVRDFDFAPKQKAVGVGESVRFVWTGDIPHSATSDATSGPDSWDSGILGKGATYEIQLQTPGEHPYYCIPHGGPGGIGMAGNITAISNCENGQDKVQIEFKVRGGSPNGYNLYIDGNLHPSSPIAYENPNGSNNEIVYLPGDGQTHLITVQDVDIDFCAYTQPVTTKDCNTACIFDDLSIDIGLPGRDTVAVTDFDFIPKNITVESRDTLVFDFVGDIPHTVTSDATNGSTVFNSGLLPKGEIYKLTIDETGQHPYYCIPHGGPNGIGMAGNIEVVDECEDGMLNIGIQFNVTGQSTAYNVYVDGELTSNSPVFYTPGTLQYFTLELPAEGQLVELALEDVQQPDCKVSTNLVMPDCDDPCYPYQADFSANVNASLLEVEFNNSSRFQGNVDFEWDFGDGNTSTESDPTHTYENVGTYKVCLILVSEDGNCTDTLCENIVVGQPACDGDFSFENEGLSVQFEGVAQTNFPTVSYQWDFGDGNTANGKSQEHVYSELGVYNICLTITADTCDVVICKEIDLSDSCLLLQAGFSTQSMGSERTVEFTNLSSGDFTYILWGFGDGNTSTEMNPTHTYARDGIYNVCLVLRDEAKDCSEYYCIEIELGNVSAEHRYVSKDWLLYPNPVHHQQPSFYLQRTSGQSAEMVSRIDIIDLYGKVVYEKEFNTGSIESIIHMNLSGRLPTGTYYVKLYKSQTIEVHKLIVQ